MSEKFFAGFTTDVEDGVFLVIGHEIKRGYQLAFLLPESRRDTVKWGHVLPVQKQGGSRNIEGNWLPLYDLDPKVKPILPYRGDAAHYMEGIADFMKSNGWTEDSDSTVGAFIEDLCAKFDQFPDGPE